MMKDAMSALHSSRPDAELLARTIERLRLGVQRGRGKWTRQREKIVTTFLSLEHVTIHGLFELMSRNGQRVSLNTIYRTLAMLCQAGIARIRHFGVDSQYDNILTKGEHDHLICVRCGHIVEFHHPAIEAQRQQVADRHDFRLSVTKLEIYGFCSACSRRPSFDENPADLPQVRAPIWYMPHHHPGSSGSRRRPRIPR